MNPLEQVKEEFSCLGYGETSNIFPPQPMEGIHDTGPPPFLTKTFDMVDNPGTDHIVSWSRASNSFVVWDLHAFSMNLLPRHFKHKNFSSFVRQLNTYGFRKVDPDRWEFANEDFLRGHKHLLKNIRRRKGTCQPFLHQQQTLGVCVEVGRFGLDREVDRLRRDKQNLMMELVELRQQQQDTRAHLQAMELRLQGTEQKQQQMTAFMARAMQNPTFIQQLVHHKEIQKQQLEITKKRRRPIDLDTSESNQSPEEEYSVKVEPLEFGDLYGFGVLDLETLAREMQGFSRTTHEVENVDGTLDEGFWEEFLNEKFSEELQEDEDVTILTDQLGYLGSSPK